MREERKRVTWSLQMSSLSKNNWTPERGIKINLFRNAIFWKGGGGEPLFLSFFSTSSANSADTSTEFLL